MLKFIKSPNAPAPGGHYSPAVIANGMVYISGQLPIIPHSQEKITGAIEVQAKQALENIEALAVAAGSSKNKIVKTTAFITSIELWAQVNQVYIDFFGEHRPARAIIPCRDLHHGFLIEIEAIAAL